MWLKGFRMYWYRAQPFVTDLVFLAGFRVHCALGLQGLVMTRFIIYIFFGGGRIVGYRFTMLGSSVHYRV